MKVTPDKLAEFRAEVPLAEFTSIGLGGNAQYFLICRKLDEIISAVGFFRTTGVPIVILGGGSNIVFPDHGFRGLVLKVDLKGLREEDSGDFVNLTVRAGEKWDDVAKYSVEHDLAGIECLSGIPGSVGGTPIQNVGAYGQEVKETIVSVKALDMRSLNVVEFSAQDCRFAYRRSRFKCEDKGRYVIVEVTYRLSKSGEPALKYKELVDYIQTRGKSAGGSGRPKLGAVRDAVLELRRKKSMLIDPADPNTRSVGSFFLNPILCEEEYGKFLGKLNQSGLGPAPAYRTEGGMKVPAAWLVENSGFHRGLLKGGVGISTNHALALVNHSGTAKELLALAKDIEQAVLRKFGVKLEREAVIIE